MKKSDEQIRPSDWVGFKGTIQARFFVSRFRSRLEDFMFGKLSGDIDRLFSSVLGDGGDFADLGCGSGYYLFKAVGKNSNTKAFGVDLSKEMLAAATKYSLRKGFGDRIELTNAPAEENGLPDSIAALVFTSNVLHETTDPARVVAEMYRLTAQGGTAAVVDFRKSETAGRFTHHHGGDAHGPMTAEELVAHFKNSGFTQVEWIEVKARMLVTGIRT